MNIWLKYVDEVTIVAPLVKGNETKIDLAYEHSNIKFKKVPGFSFTSFTNNLISLFKLPIIFWEVFWAIKNTNHIHLRCPGNIGLVGCVVQIFFPSKIKTAKYAGNWDPASKQPWTYRLQKYILNNSFLTKNMQVLVYGEWPQYSKNIKSFFTATYSNSEKEIINKAYLEPLHFIFTGSLVKGKNPMYAVELLEKIIMKGNNVIFNIYGEGNERKNLEDYIQANNLQNNIFLHGNQDKESLKASYRKSHFVILPSKSEGWPKTLAEGMFWGCVPIATKVSCVPFMLDQGNRGILLEMDLEKDLKQIQEIIENRKTFLNKSKLAETWSQKFTTDSFEKEIKKLILK
ncbi:glycosyltransferase [Flavobacterium ginsengiterrae]